jgi:hypothetical protein
MDTNEQPTFKSQKGLIAYLDVLGYKNFLNNNLVDKIANIIVDILYKIPENIKNNKIEEIDSVFKFQNETLKKRFLETISCKEVNLNSSSLDNVDEILKSFNIIMVKVLQNIIYFSFSDTILIVIPYSPVKNDVEGGIVNNLIKVLFGYYISDLYNILFKNGLPIRGVITEGEFILDDKNHQIFAGKPLIEAYEESYLLEISAVVISNKNHFSEEFLNAYKFMKLGTLFKYSIPLKNKEFQNYYTINPSVAWEYNTREKILESFVAHNKNLPESAIQKLNNTEIFFKYFTKNLLT